MTIIKELSNQRAETGRWISAAFGLGLLGLVVGCQPAPPPEETLDLSSDKAKASYTMGYDISTRLTSQLEVDIDSDAFAAGAGDGVSKADRQVTQEQAKEALDKMNEEAKAKAEAKMAEVKDAGMAFLAENGAKEGVVTLDSGLQYMVLTAAPEGASKPGPTDAITAHYHGTLVDGTVFDSSMQRGEPATFPLNGVIPGWTEALQLMGVGAKWRLFLPPQLAYGERPAGSIPPNSTLIFDVELLEIQN